MSIYNPQEDSYLLSKALSKFLRNEKKDAKILDMGSGSGIQAKTCKNLGFKNILAADINPEAIKLLKTRGFDVIQSDLFSNLYKRKGDLLGKPLVPIRFDLIIFNPPYLPEDEYDKKPDTTGGKYGYELIIRFLEESKNHLKPQGKILLLFSSLSKPKIILKKAKELGYKIHPLSKKKLFFEELGVYLIEKNKLQTKLFISFITTIFK
jgi:release factor glutamine methyltransferase